MSLLQRRVTRALFILGLVALPATAVAQDIPEETTQEELAPEDVKTEVEVADDQKRGNGWHYLISLGANASLNHSDNVVGAIDGLTVALGLILRSELDLVAGDHEWQNSLTVEHQQTQTPVIDGFIKSADWLEFKSLYLWRALDWLGPFARFKLQTALFPGFDRRPNDTTLLKTDRSGVVSTEVVPAEESIDLTNSFEPLIITESIGVFADPFTSKAFTIKFKLGVGGQHIIVGDGFFLDDDEDTDELELTQLESANSAGAEFEVELLGGVADNVTWSVLTNFFYPFVTTQETDLEGIDTLHTDIGANLSVKLAQWLSLDYALSARRLPFVIDEWQISNQVLFTAAFAIQGNTSEGAEFGGAVE